MKPGITELLVVLAIVIIVFGPTQIPKLTKMFGKSVKSFKEGMEEPEAEEVPAEKKSAKVQKAKAAKGSAPDEEE